MIGATVNYTALVLTVKKLNEAIENSVQIHTKKEYMKDEEWIWHMLSLGRVTNYFEQMLSEFDDYIQNSDCDS